jgi:hypothetical protein
VEELMRVGRGMLVVVAFAVGCTSSVSATTRLVQYASGAWGCRLRSATLDARLAVGVRATGDASGTVTLRWVGLSAPPSNLAGPWRLDGERLTVWLRAVPELQDVDSSLGPVHGRHIALDARRITVRGETAGRPGIGKIVQVAVRRDGDRIRFGFDMPTVMAVPGQEISSRATVTCVKAG